MPQGDPPPLCRPDPQDDTCASHLPIPNPDVSCQARPVADPFIEHLRAVWADLGDVPVAAFSSDVPHAVATAGSRLCPPGWVGAVVIDGSALITAPSEESAKHVSRTLATLRGEQVTDPDVVSALLPVAEVLGPAWLSYLNPASPPRLHPTGHAERLVADHDDLQQLQRAVSPRLAPMTSGRAACRRSPPTSSSSTRTTSSRAHRGTAAGPIR